METTNDISLRRKRNMPGMKHGATTLSAKDTSALRLPGAAPHMLITVIFALSVAIVPVCSYQEEWSNYPQYLSGLAICIAVVSLAMRGTLPSMHPAMSAYLVLTLFFGITGITNPAAWEGYQTMLKVCFLSLAVHFMFRTPRQLLILLGIYSAIGVITVWLNYDELHRVSSAILWNGRRERFAGTFANANTAGLYGVTAILLSIIFFVVNRRGVLRWTVLLAGVASGVVIGYYTGSRKAMIAMFLIAVTLPWLFVRKSKDSSRIVINLAVGILTLLVAIMALPHLPNSERLLAMLQGDAVMTDESTFTRMNMINKAVDLWASKPVFGVGYDGFTRLSGFDTYSHSSFSEILCNGGLFGIALILLYYILPAKDLLKSIWLRHDGSSRTLEVGLLIFYGLIIFFSTFCVMYQARDYTPMCAAICGYLEVGRQKRKRAALTVKRLSMEAR